MPSLINELLVEELKGVLDAAPSALFIDAAGLQAPESLDLRKKLFDAGATMKVAKSRLVRKLVDDDISGHLEGRGSLAVVVAEDVAAAAKVVNELAKDEKVTIRAASVEGKAFDGKSAAKLADLPSKPELQAKLLGTLQAPMANFVSLLNNVNGGIVTVLENYRKKLAGED